ncbi:MAG: class I SAM-dependent methyltransferase [Promethearchaeota archaeon]|jgi:ubiquinone/menaquinone biosynthesis C-methylase UbiE
MKNNEDDYLYIDGQHYDNQVRSRRLEHYSKFFIDQAKKYGAPVLELACGTGEITIPIAQEGLSIVGLDFSKKMLKQAQQKSKRNGIKIEWILGDMTHFELKKKFSTILMPGAAFNWITSNESVEKCLSCVRKHLKRGGRFIFDAFNPDLAILQRERNDLYPMDEYPNPEGEGIVEVLGGNEYEKATQISYFDSYYKIGTEEIVKTLKLRMFFPQELDSILYYNGFKIEEKYGSFSKEPFNSDSNRQIIICQKSK